MSTTQTTPEVTWAQRSNDTVAEKNIVYLTVAAPDVPKSALKVDLKPQSLFLTGHSETKKTTYHVEIDFFAEIDLENSATHHTERDVEFVLRKKEKQAEFWPRLTKEKQKLHFLKTNFDKWVDEDEQDGAPDENPMAGMDPAASGGLGGIDFSKLAGTGGGDFGAGDMDLGAGAEDSDADDDMPDLEGEADEEEGTDKKGKGKAKEAGEGSSKPKIEEVN